MALETTTVRAELNGDGSEGPFQCGFRVLNASDVKVYVDGSATAKTLTTHYTVANAGTTSNATVTFTAGNFPQAGTKNVVLVREVPYTQPSNYQNNTALDAETLEASFDRATMQAQQSTEKIDRALKFSDTATGIDADVTEISAPADSRKNKYIGFDDSGNMSLSDAVSNPLITSTSPQAGDMLRYNGSKYVNTPIKDEDDMASNSDAHVPSQQSVKAYVDAQIATEDTIAELNDTTITGTPADNEVLAYDSSSSKWINQTASEAGLTTGDLIDEDTMATDSATRPPSQQSVKAYADQLAFQGKPHIIPGVLYPSYVASGTSNKLLDGTTSHSGAFGTVQSDGRKYYYTNIAGSKPIKDPRIGGHFGSQRHKFKSLQLLEQETATHGNDVFSIDGREWCRLVNTGSVKFIVENGDGGNGLNVTSHTFTAFFEITGYFNDFNCISWTKSDRADDIDITVNGGTVRGSANTNKLAGRSSVQTPLHGRYVDAGSVINHGDSDVASDLGTTPSINTIKIEATNTGSEYWRFYGIELIAQDTSNRNNIQIPSQNVVSYGKKFTVSGTPHYNPFAFKTDGTTAWTSGNHNGTAWPVGTGASANIDTATSLGLSAWISTNHYYPYNGGRVVWWVDSSGTLKCSVNMMPPNARSIANSASLTNGTEKGDDSAGTSSASVANNTFYPTFTDQAIEHSLSEVAKTFHWREFGNGSANGGAGATYADASMLDATSSPVRNIAFVMDDGLTSLSGSAVIANTHPIGYANTTDKGWYFTFIGTGFTFIGRANGSNVPSVPVSIVQNLPYGTHVVKIFTKSDDQETTVIHVDGVQVYSANDLLEYAGIVELTIHQPKRPSIPEDAVVLADYMLLADYVKSDAGGLEKVSKGVRLISSSRDIFYDGSTYDLDFSDMTGKPYGMRAYLDSTPSAGTGKMKLPAFGTHVELGVYTDTLPNARGDIFVDDVDMAQTVSGTSDTYNGLITQDNASTLGLHTFESRSTGNNHNTNRFGIATPIHTSSHYQSFETPFLHELIGGDRNMEQTNLICTPDGRSWDEVTRDTSYIGRSKIQFTRDGGDLGSSQVTFIADVTRGMINTHTPMIQKYFAIAYDRLICLKAGNYRVNFNAHGDAGGVEAYAYIYLNAVLQIMRESDPDASRGNPIVETTLNLKRGDFLEFKGLRLEGGGQAGYQCLIQINKL